MISTCVRCLMNNNVDPSIKFTSDGLCNHCQRYDHLKSSRLNLDNTALDKIVSRIKASGNRKEYDCIVGVSGGVDSTYVAFLVKKMGLRPLAVHVDNGWNSELAVKNIENTLKKLNIDLVTNVLDWDEFKDLQLSFLKSSTPDCEIPSDHAIFATLWKEATKRNIKYIISGMNFATESLSVPNWSYGHSDWRYIKSVHKIFGKKKLKTYPHFSLFYLLYINIFKGIRTISILNYVNYNKDDAMSVLQGHLGWIYYGGKHFESIYTRFYQGYLLPKKFGIDKRYGHLSDLINSGQITKEEAINELQTVSYSIQQKNDDISFVRKKLELSEDEFEKILNQPPKIFNDYPNSFLFLNFLKFILNKLRFYRMYPK
jgi:N-acetyl sugar amidotransferase